MATERSNIFSSDIHSLKLQTVQKRLMQAGITLTAVALPLTALIAPNQSTDMKLWELGLGSLFGGAGAFVAREREDIENRHSSFLDLHREHERGSIKNEFAFHSATQEIRGELNLAGAINALRQPPVMARYMNKFQLQGLIALPEPKSEDLKSAEPEWLNSPFQYTPASQLKPGEEQASADWIIQIVTDAIAPYSKRNHQHLIINAPTQSGKSTLAACFIGLFCKALGGRVTTLVIDPKHSDTNWLVPVDFGGFESAYNGLKKAIAELDKRKELARAAQSKGLLKPDFERFLIILDEWNILYGGGKGYAQIISKEMAEEMLADVQRLLNESAFLNMTLVLIGQSPLSGDNGLSRPIMENATRVTLNKTAIRWLNDKDFPNVELKAPFKKKINGWLKDKRRCALVVPMSGEPFCSLIPVINLDFFNEQFNEDEESAIETTADTSPETTEPTEKPRPNLLEMITKWYAGVVFEFGHEPNDGTLLAAWKELTGSDLSEEALNFLRTRIRESFASKNDYHNN